MGSLLQTITARIWILRTYHSEVNMADNKRKGPLEGPIKRILESQDRTEENVARLTAAVASIKTTIDGKNGGGRLSRLVARLGL